MLFNSPNFVFFFIIVTTIYFSVPYRFRWLLLLLSSCYFYMAFVPVYILILAFTIVVDYFAGIMIENAADKKKRLFLIFSLVANIGILAVFKYYNFINYNLAVLLSYSGRTNPIPYLTILLPLGLSFHTFQAMAYTIEVFRGNQRAERHFGIYALYVMFYPQMVAGPIERPQNMIYQFYEKYDFDYKRVTDGLKLMLWGFFKKIVIADNLALVVNKVYDDPYHFKGLGIAMAAIAFAFQIFCDFSGYSDIAIGAAQVMGFKLMTNFTTPLISKNVTEFWRKWHISLSTWFNDYLFMPLSFAKRDWGKMGVAFALVVTFLISGLWHGAAWTFIAWGLLHAMAVVYELLTKKTRKKWAKSIPRVPYLTISILLTFLFNCLTWIFFRALNVHQAIYLVKNIFTAWRIDDARVVLQALGQYKFSRMMMLLFLAVLGFTFYYKENNYGSIRALIAKQFIAVRWSVYFFLVFSIFLFGAFDNLRFIYFQF